MNDWVYAMFIERGKTYNKMTKAVVEQHVENLRRLDGEGKIELCGVFKGYPGVAGMVIIRAESLEAADAIAKEEPLVMLGYATYTLRQLQLANAGNNYLM